MSNINTKSGNAGGLTKIVSKTITVSLSAYTSGDVVGGVQTITDGLYGAGGTGILQSVTIIDVDARSAAFTIDIFSQQPQGTYTDNGAYTLVTADSAYLIARVSVVAGDYVTAGGKGVATVTSLNIPVFATGTANLYALISTTSTPTWTATTNLSIVWGILQD